MKIRHRWANFVPVQKESIVQTPVQRYVAPRPDISYSREAVQTPEPEIKPPSEPEIDKEDPRRFMPK